MLIFLMLFAVYCRLGAVIIKTIYGLQLTSGGSFPKLQGYVL